MDGLWAPMDAGFIYCGILDSGGGGGAVRNVQQVVMRSLYLIALLSQPMTRKCLTAVPLTVSQWPTGPSKSFLSGTVSILVDFPGLKEETWQQSFNYTFWFLFLYVCCYSVLVSCTSCPVCFWRGLPLWIELVSCWFLISRYVWVLLKVGVQDKQAEGDGA